MLVCAKCGTPVAVAGHACAACGHRGAIDSRFYQGEVKAAAAAPTASTEVPLDSATAGGVLPDEQRAWSPWLATVIGLLLGPAAGALLACRNLQRLERSKLDPWSVAGGVLVAQVVLALPVGYLARTHAQAAWLVLGVVNLLAAAGVGLWQAEPVRSHRAAHVGRHTPGADAFGVFLLALIIGLAGLWASYRVGDKVSHGELASVVDQAFPKPAASAPPMHEMELPPPQ